MTIIEPSKKPLQTLHPIPPLILTIIVGAVMLVSKMFLGVSVISFPYASTITMLLIIIGGIPFTGAVYLFIKARTTVNPTQPDASSSLVTHGIYRFTRNPMYLGFLLWLMAWGIYLEEIVAISGPLFFYWYINRYQIPFEEVALNKHFSDVYVAYCNTTRRWL